MDGWLTICRVCEDTFPLEPMEHLQKSHAGLVMDVNIDPVTKHALITDVYEQEHD